MPNEDLREQIKQLGASDLALLKRTLSQASEKQRAGRPERYVASSAQRLMWLNSQLEPSSAAYNNTACLRLRGRLDGVALERALAAVVSRHSPLRSTFEAGEDGTPLWVNPGNRDFQLMRSDVSGVPLGLRDIEARRIAVAAAREPIDLERGPVFKSRLIRLDAEDHLLIITIHHIVSDGWSFQLLFRELIQNYQRSLADEPLNSAPLKRSFRDCMETERLFEKSKGFRLALTRWVDRLRGAPHLLALPLDHPRPPARSSVGERLPFSFSSHNASLLHRVCARLGSTPFEGAYATFAALLHRYCGQPDICIGTPVMGRNSDDSKEVVGLFMNVAVLRMVLDPQESFKHYLARAAQTLSEAQDDGRVPLHAVVDAVAPIRSTAFTPLYQVVFAMNNAPSEDVDIDGLRIEPIDLDLGIAQTDIALSLRIAPGQVSGYVDYSTDLFERRTIEQMLAHWEQLAVSACSHPEVPLGSLEILTPADKLLLRNWSRCPGFTGEGKELALHHYVLNQAVARPEAIAVHATGTDYTYAQLVASSRAVANALMEQGVRSGDYVGIYSPRSFAAIAGMLGTVQVGAGYVPVPWDTPAARAESMLRQAGCSMVLCHASLRPKLPQNIRRMDIEEVCASEAPDSSPALGHFDFDTPAYIMFTSGSTGTPKGVLVSSRGLTRRLRWLSEAYPLTPNDRVLQTTSIGFDISVAEIFGTLIAGATIVLSPDGGSGNNPQRWIDLVENQAVTILSAVPSWMRMFFSAANARLFPHLRRVLLVGETLPRELVNEIHGRTGAEVINAYGPTEGIIYQTAHRCERHSLSVSVPIGKPLHDVVVRVLDGDMNLVPVGVEGDLFTGGPSLAAGYVGVADLTAERFIPDPFAEVPGGLLYRTGDRVKWSRGGELLFCGRKDFQVKLHGYRVELEEIERVLGKHPCVQECAVAVQGDSQAPRLVAFVVLKTELDHDAALREHLARELPSYMLPMQYIRRAQLPKNSNGKVDRKSLLELQELEESSPANSELEIKATSLRQARIADWFYKPAWRRAGAYRSEPHLTPAKVLLLADSRGIGDRIAEQLRSSGHTVLCVYVANSFSIENEGRAYVNPRQAGDCALLCQYLVAHAYAADVLLHLWPVDTSGEGLVSPQGLLSTIEASCERDYFSFIEIVSGVYNAFGKLGLRILIAARGLNRIHQNEESQPGSALLLASVRVLPQEFPGVTCRLIDLDPADHDQCDHCSQVFMEELDAREAPEIVALRAGVRWERHFVPAPLPPEPEVSPLFRTRGTYVITGGLGGLGLELADFLSSTCQANLVLLSRRGLPPAEEWPGNQEPGKQAVFRRIQLMEERGSQVLVLAADVGDREAMESAFSQARSRFGPIHGVIHAAGIVEYRVLTRRNRTTAGRVLLPKVQGTLVLLNLLAKNPAPDFVVLFSSLAAPLGGVGSLDYCAANNFLDSVASSGMGPARVLSIGWGLWGEVGAGIMDHQGSAGPTPDEVLEQGISCAEGVQAFVRALASGWRHVIISPRHLGRLIANGSSHLAEFSSARPNVHQAPLSASGQLTDGQDDLEAVIAQIWQDLLGLRDLKKTASFFDLGGNSFQLVTMANLVSKRCGRLLALPRILSDPTVTHCARVLRELGATAVEPLHSTRGA